MASSLGVEDWDCVQAWSNVSCVEPEGMTTSLEKRLYAVWRAIHADWC